MARDYDAGRAKIDSLVETCKKDCLVESDSLLFDERAIWTIPHLEDFRQRFLGNPLYGTEENFGQKLTTQLETASEDVCWLVCELIAVYFLFAVGAVGGPTKRATLEAIIAPLGEERPHTGSAWRLRSWRGSPSRVDRGDLYQLATYLSGHDVALGALAYPPHDSDQADADLGVPGLCAKASKCASRVSLPLPPGQRANLKDC